MLSGSMNAADLGSDVATHSPMRTTLFDLLSNDLILLHTSPYLGATTIFSVASLSRSFRKLICSSPRVLNYLDLSEVRSLRRPQWYQSPQEHSDLITEDDYYARPLERALSALQPVFLQSVRTLILDRVNTSVRLLIDLLTNPAYQIRILSLQAVEGLTDGSLLQTLRYLVRSSRQHRSLKLKALYYFQVGSSSLVEKTFTDNTIIGEIEGITTKSGARLGAGNQGFSGTVLDDDPYARSAYKTHGVCPTFARDINWSDWASLLRACQELIAFDVVLCPRCCSEIASIRLAGCQSCGSCPEKPAYPSHCVSIATTVSLISIPSLELYFFSVANDAAHFSLLRVISCISSTVVLCFRSSIIDSWRHFVIVRAIHGRK